MLIHEIVRIVLFEKENLLQIPEINLKKKVLQSQNVAPQMKLLICKTAAQKKRDMIFVQIQIHFIRGLLTLKAEHSKQTIKICASI